MKKIFNLMLIFVLTLMVLIPNVSAVENGDEKGTITITGTLKGKKYNVYQILVLDSYDDTNKNGKFDDEDGYVYSVSPAWSTFLNQTGIKDVYVEIDSKNQVTWKGTADQKEFAKLALAYAKANGIAASKEEQESSANGATITFSDLNLGYYLVDSTGGALCGLTTTRPTAEVIEKNSDPTVTKQVKEDSSNEYGNTNTADIGQLVEFKTTIKVGKGAENYVLTDIMSDGLSFNSNSLTVKLNGTDLNIGTDYTVSFTEPGKTFVITFDNDYAKTLAENSEIIVEYTANVDIDAIVGETGNTNTAELKYGDNNALTSTTRTYTYSFDLVKTDKDKKLLNGATFELYEKTPENTTDRLISFVIANGVYQVSHNGGTVTSIEAGKVTISGLDEGNYYLKEIDAPDGYAKLLEDVDVNISGANNPATMESDNITYKTGGVHVINTKGDLLPSTGGIGTTLFVVIGSLMVTLFGLLLVTKYRMSKMDN